MGEVVRHQTMRGQGQAQLQGVPCMQLLAAMKMMTVISVRMM
jgi:hypothetical protein